jgi:NADH-quinone oxidoreductase subunit C
MADVPAPDAEATADPATADVAPEPDLVHGVPAGWSHGQRVVHPSRDELVGLVRQLHDDGYLMCLDLCGVDYLDHPDRELPAGIAPERFEVVVTLISHRDASRIRLRVQVPAADPVVPSLFELHPGTDAMERETFDMFGISFEGHPDLTRILMPEDWIGHPLRKDYDSGRIPVQFKGAPAR